jgi:hypothetical protein
VTAPTVAVMVTLPAVRQRTTCEEPLFAPKLATAVLELAQVAALVTFCCEPSLECSGGNVVDIRVSENGLIRRRDRKTGKSRAARQGHALFTAPIVGGHCRSSRRDAIHDLRRNVGPGPSEATAGVPSVQWQSRLHPA